MKNPLDTILSRIDQTFDQSLSRLFELLRIPSISTDPAYHSSCEQAAEWIAATLSDLGFTVNILPTNGNPTVLAHWKPQGPCKKTVLFYGHYDVQPADPIDLWETPPFDPHVKTVAGRKQIVARGASDDKGQLMTFIEAFRVWFESGHDLPLALTVLIEGEEENGSPSLEAFLDQYRQDLLSDLIFVCDTTMWDSQTPAMVTSLRGLMIEEVVLDTDHPDLHSGFYGGVALNPLHTLCQIVAQLHDADGIIQIPGFYNNVSPWPETLPQFSETEFLRGIGQSTSSGEKEYRLLESLWSRPSCDLNGIWGGYTGFGAKTVIPSQASAKVSFRLVPGQDPAILSAAFRDFVSQRLPDGVSARFTSHASSKAVTLSLQPSLLDPVNDALQDEFGVPPVFIGCGATIPIVRAFQRNLHRDAFLLGFASEEDRIHSPNEKYDQDSFYRGIRSWVRILHALSRL